MMASNCEKLFFISYFSRPIDEMEVFGLVGEAVGATTTTAKGGKGGVIIFHLKAYGFWQWTKRDARRSDSLVV